MTSCAWWNAREGGKSRKPPPDTFHAVQNEVRFASKTHAAMQGARCMTRHPQGSLTCCLFHHLARIPTPSVCSTASHFLARTRTSFQPAGPKPDPLPKADSQGVRGIANTAPILAQTRKPKPYFTAHHNLDATRTSFPSHRPKPSFSFWTQSVLHSCSGVQKSETPFSGPPRTSLPLGRTSFWIFRLSFRPMPYIILDKPCFMSLSTR